MVHLWSWLGDSLHKPVLVFSVNFTITTKFQEKKNFCFCFVLLYVVDFKASSFSCKWILSSTAYRSGQFCSILSLLPACTLTTVLCYFLQSRINMWSAFMVACTNLELLFCHLHVPVLLHVITSSLRMHHFQNPAFYGIVKQPTALSYQFFFFSLT